MTRSFAERKKSIWSCLCNCVSFTLSGADESRTVYKSREAFLYWVPRTYEIITFPFSKQPKIPSFTPGLSQNIALHVLPASVKPVLNFSLPVSLNFIFFSFFLKHKAAVFVCLFFSVLFFAMNGERGFYL